MPVTQKTRASITTGETLTAKAFAKSDDVTVVQTASAVTEIEDSSSVPTGIYLATFTDLPAGDYFVHYYAGGTKLSDEGYRITLDTATFDPVDFALLSALLNVPSAAENATAAAAAILDDASNKLVTNASGQVEASNASDALSGPSNLTVTVTDEDTDDPIESATVKIYKSGESGVKTTDASGEAVYTVTDSTWSYTATASGYDGATGTKVVSGDTSLSIALAAKVVSEPDDPSLATLTVKCVDRAGAVQKGVRIVVQITKVPSGSTGIAFSNAVLVDVSGADGMVSFDLTRGATYKIQRTDTGKTTTVLIPATGTPSVESFFGP